MANRLKYGSAAELQAAVDAYFASCRGHYRRDDAGAYVLDRRGRPIVDGATPMTITGLQSALGFRTRKSLHDYGKRQEFSDIIHRARLMVENYAEERLFDRDGYSGARFVLQNGFGWRSASTAEDKSLPSVRVVQAQK